MELMIILPLAAFVILATLFFLFLRRAGRLVAVTRDVERFRRQIGDLAARIETSLGQLCARVDAVRRGQLSATSVVDDLTASMDAVAKYADEARELKPPTDAIRIRDEIVAELDRAKRALEMIEHGVSIQVSARGGARELESQTAVKRGYLNVLHSREAIARHAVEAAAVEPVDPTRRTPSSRSA
jgi:hypothetical protein